jgi:hypothetical protein
MTWMFLFFLREPWFVLPWYGMGVFGLLFVLHDMRTSNAAIARPLKWAWPIAVFFSSFVGLALYFATSRPWGMGKAAFHEQPTTGRRVGLAAVLSVAGSGLGIMTAMVIARAAGMSVWQEFWFEYVVGFAVGWLILQRPAAAGATGDLTRRLASSFGAEFFSMLTIMGGFGLVMDYLAPMVGTLQAEPLTYAFWGFGALGLMVGYLLTFPMSWLLLELGWQRDLDDTKDHVRLAESVKSAALPAAERRAATGGNRRGLRFLLPAMALGCAALLLVATLSEVREVAPSRDEPAARIPEAAGAPGRALAQGTQISIVRAIAGLRLENWTEASLAMNDAWRAVQTGTYAAPEAFFAARAELRQARIAYQNGEDGRAEQHLDAAYRALGSGRVSGPVGLDLARYAHASVINPEGEIIGNVAGVSSSSVDLVLGGWRHALGFLALSPGRHLEVPVSALAFGPARPVGSTFVAIPTKLIPGRRPSSHSPGMGRG